MNLPAPTFSPAGFWKRYVAYSIDLLLVSIALELLSRIFLSGQGAGEMAQLQSILTAVQNHQELSPEQTALLTRLVGSMWNMLVMSTFAYAAIAGAYFVLFESSAWQATPGKRLVGIKVVDGGGKPIGRGRAVARFLAAGLSWISLNIGHAMAAIPPQHRALHDYVADTRVENTDPSRPGMPIWGWLVIGAQALAMVLGVGALVVAMASVISAASQF